MNFVRHAEIHGLIIQHLIPDGRWHRVPTVDKPRKRNGAYLYDGSRGVVRNWATMEGFSQFPERGSIVTIDRGRLLEDRKKAEAEEARKRARAASEAARMISKAQMARHPYLAKKGFPEALGLVFEGVLIIPMRGIDGTLLSAQMIGEDKKFLFGGRTKGAVHVLGNKFDDVQKWFVEGYATGLSVKAALDAMHRKALVFVCFSAGNLRYVAERVGGRRFVFADNDESGVGRSAAEGTGLPWVMSPVVGEDANDLHQRSGIWALIDLMRGLK
jgi:putative DNA primase/helicase